jgi:hypothetical protein
VMRILLYVLAISAIAFSAQAADLCMYVAGNGSLVQVNGLDKVPAKYRPTARCLTEKVQSAPGELAAPQDIKLDGNVRKVSLATALGRMELRWPRKVELLFGRTPERALQDAAGAVNRLLQRGFPAVFRESPDWRVVFMDEELPESQIPQYLVSNCHPAWMTPPANIYVVAQRVAAGCTGEKVKSSVADGELASVLIHEIGHAVEFQLTGGADPSDRARAEGFASWFESVGSDYSAEAGKGVTRSRYIKAAKLNFSPERAQMFGGGFEDYAVASMQFFAIVNRRGIPGLVRVYNKMQSGQAPFAAALKSELGWNGKQLASEIEQFLKKAG